MCIGVWARSLQLPYANSRKRPPREVRQYIYKPAIYFCELLFDKTDNVIKNRTMVIRGYLPSDLNRRLMLFRRKKNQETRKHSS